MTTFMCKYPGDTPCLVNELNRAEFLAACPREPTRITYSDGTVEEIPMEPDEIMCDSCSDDPGDLIYLIEGKRAWCKKCYDEILAPHRIGEG